ncbi:SDR family oxidoreductase [Lactococcus insecticola]|uniref:Oxidoreductase n=1 Tax=Pseudolactococcus insecticola TaxID=2709158 RepID=A0A6A0B404_9LACT|nr:SDR family NAD(P)-dependent oxidoreductase [Lactococcus insecticola]GFH39892.1 oxidoreductase [Lactococcus insecticola]
MKLTNNTILITGGTSGIGLAFAQKFLALGNTVIVTGRSQAKIDAAISENPGLYGIAADVSDAADVARLAQKVLSDFPNLNVVMNSAGIMRTYDLFDDDLKATDLLAEIDTNLNGTILVSQTFLKHLTAQPESLLVNVSSGLANVSSAPNPIYSATKAGVHMFTDAVREQVIYQGYTNLQVTELVPPLVSETNLEENVHVEGPNNMTLTDLVAEGITGIENGSTRIDAGFAKVIRKNALENPEHFTHQMAENMLPNKFARK